LRFRGINQLEKSEKHKNKKKTKTSNTDENTETGQTETRWKQINQPKGYTAAVNGYFGFNAVAQSGPGIQK
jgi:hypothetical protein